MGNSRREKTATFKVRSVDGRTIKLQEWTEATPMRVLSPENLRTFFHRRYWRGNVEFFREGEAFRCAQDNSLWHRVAQLR